MYPNDMQFINSILWDDSPGSEILIEDSSTVTVTHSDVTAIWSGEGNQAVDPKFADADCLDDVFSTPDDNADIGTFQPNSGATDCLACDAGTYASEPGQA